MVEADDCTHQNCLVHTSWLKLFTGSCKVARITWETLLKLVTFQSESTLTREVWIQPRYLHPWQRKRITKTALPEVALPRIASQELESYMDVVLGQRAYKHHSGEPCERSPLMTHNATFTFAIGNLLDITDAEVTKKRRRFRCMLCWTPASLSIESAIHAKEPKFCCSDSHSTGGQSPRIRLQMRLLLLVMDLYELRRSSSWL